LLGAALEANRSFADLIAQRLAEGGSYDALAILAKRRAEAANSAVFSSLQRMMGDPRQHQDGLENVAAYANGNQRVSRALTVMALQLTPGSPLSTPAIVHNFKKIAQTLRQLGEQIQPLTLARETTFDQCERSDFVDTDQSLGQQDPRERWVLGQLARITTELNAMKLATGITDRISLNASSASSGKT
jgi:hypothetical protein